MFVFVLFVALISTILLVQSEETTATTSTSNENIVPVSAELRLKTEIIQERRLGATPVSTVEDLKKVIEEPRCLCSGFGSFNHCGKGKDSTFTICCVPDVPCMCCKKVDASYDAYRLAITENTTKKDVDAVHVNNALAFMLPKSFVKITANPKTE